MVRCRLIDTEATRKTPAIEAVPRSAPFRVLILGGTGEASELARRLADQSDLSIVSSLAGRVNQPKIPEGPVRIGGFGGVDGLISFLQNERIGAVIDATHPFAARISASAELACNRLGLPLIVFSRVPWAKQEADRWHVVLDTRSAAAYVAQTPGRVFLAIGRQQLDTFAACSNAWFLIRAIDPPDVSLPPNTKLILERGPFHLEHELQLLRDHAIEYIVSKNSGGPATYAKIEAARLLGIPVVMVERPQKHSVPSINSVDGVLATLNRLQPIAEFCTP
ncbi:MAG TPA: cobalt-precorrin-6A reductase [Edaphobacter sp.]|nr:cobalt-precorrin-6A reductase [Edaphobacter sp.]